MMINVRLEALAKAIRNLKGLGLTLGYNFLWAPLFGFVLSKLFLHDPEVGFGFLLVMVVPCSSMSIGYTGLAGGEPGTGHCGGGHQFRNGHRRHSLLAGHPGRLVPRARAHGNSHARDPHSAYSTHGAGLLDSPGAASLVR